ncbi:MAG: hypothetical protein ABIQ15_14715 [Nocardioides sp.]
MSDWIVWVPSALLAVVGLALALVIRTVVRLRARTADELATAHADAARLGRRLDELEHRLEGPEPRPSAPDYVITEMSTTGPAGRRRVEGRPAAPEHRIEGSVEGSLFADLLLRESVVRGASFVHGVRRALAPETRHRIRFEMRQEVKRSRKQRRIDLKAARRHLAEQQRAADDAEDAA